MGKVTLMSLEKSLWNISYERCAKEYINSIIFNSTNGVVISGPFKGMKILEEVAWEDGNLGPKVLGCYEQELHGFIEDQIENIKGLGRPAKILDIGCSEGYYAVGMALRLPDAEIIAVDESEDALRLTELALSANNVTNVQLLKDCPYQFEPDLVICDCEGGEMVYIDPVVFPGLINATMLIECHDLPERQVTNAIDDRFQETHQFWFVTEGSRNPNEYDLLIKFPSMVRWLAVSEGRPCRMHWLVLKPNAKGEA